MQKGSVVMFTGIFQEDLYYASDDIPSQSIIGVPENKILGTILDVSLTGILALVQWSSNTEYNGIAWWYPTDTLLELSH